MWRIRWPTLQRAPGKRKTPPFGRFWQGLDQCVLWVGASDVRHNERERCTTKQSERAGERDLVEGRGAFGVEADAEIAQVAQFGQRAGEVGDRADRHVLEPAGGGFGVRAGKLRRMALGRDQRVDCEGRGGAQDRPDIVRVGDLVKDEDQAVRRKFGEVDRRERPRFQEHALMHRIARGTGSDLLEAQDPRLDPARFDLGLEPLGRGLRGVEADKLPPRRLQRRLDAVEAVDAGDVGLSLFARPLAPRLGLGRRRTRRIGRGAVSALGAPNIGERPEREIISAFVNRIAELAPQLVTFNGAAFDLPVLRYRAMVCGIAAPGLAARPYFNRYSEDAIDLCDVLSSFSSQSKSSLQELCRVMGLPGKPDGISGADVERYCGEGRVAEVAAYCETDVVNTYRVWLRYELFRGRLTENGLQASEANLRDYIRSRSDAKPHLAYVLVEEQKRASGPDARTGVQ